MTPTEQDKELDEIVNRIKRQQTIERLLRFNCPFTCDGNGSYIEAGSDGEPEQAQCQWCFEYGIPVREAIGQYAERVALEARIDELERTMPHTDGMRHYNTVKRRIAELKAQQEEV